MSEPSDTPLGQPDAPDAPDAAPAPSAPPRDGTADEVAAGTGAATPAPVEAASGARRGARADEPARAVEAGPAGQDAPTVQDTEEAQPGPVGPAPVDRAAYDHLVGGAHAQPHAILGPHVHGGRVTVRVLRPWAEQVAVLHDGTSTPLAHERDGIWVGVLDAETVPDYRVRVTYHGSALEGDDPYRFLPTLGELDQHLVAEGRHEQLWQVLGAHTRTYESAHGPVHGTSFAVWAPNARGVRVAADFNSWDSRSHPMRLVGSTGVWELFVPGVGDGTRYKYEVLGADGGWRLKADPLAFATEVPPETASVVFTSTHEWADDAWIASRTASAEGNGGGSQPMSVYEVHLGSWRRGLGYRELAEQLTAYCLELGFTHVELLPVAEHPYGGSWGYQVTSYFAPTSRFGSPDELRHLVDALHQAGIGVIVDWVPAHFPRDAWALARFDGTPLYEHADPRRGEQPDWGTYVFDFARREVRNFLVANAIFWCEEFHVDGLRVDAVASMLYLDYSRQPGQWLPNEYGGRENLDAVRLLQEVNATVHKRLPGVLTIAEESTAWPGVTRPTHLGGLGFDLKWNMGWMHDSLAYLAQPPVYRQFHHHQMTFSMMYAYSERFVLPLSHDEVVHGKGSLLRKMPGDRWQQLANLRAYLAYMWAHPGKQLLFMGGELGQESEWAESRELDWWLLDHPEHRGVQRLVADLNRLYRDNPALWRLDDDPAGFSWIDANDNTGNVFSFVRRDGEGGSVACVANFAGVPRGGYRMGLPARGDWTEVVNTDAQVYGGSGVGNLGAVRADGEPWHGLPHSATLTLPPLGVLWLRGPDAAAASLASSASRTTASDEPVTRGEATG